MKKLHEILGKRLEKLQVAIKDAGIHSVLIVQPENRRYYSGFTGSNGWLSINADAAYIVTDSRYYLQAVEECPHFQLVKCRPLEGKSLLKAFIRLIEEGFSGGEKEGLKTFATNRIGFEASALTVDTHKLVTESLAKFSFEPFDEMIGSPRLVKDHFEIDMIRNAVRIAEEGFSRVNNEIRVGMQERELVAELDYRMKLSGSQKVAFDTIVAAGENGALPHARGTERQIGAGEALIIDWGAMDPSGYNSDMTRTLFLGEPDLEMAKIYRIVREAQEKVLERIKPGMKTGEADAIARDHIADKGYGEYFGHGLGHGVGLAIHEGPTLRSGDEAVLKPGMVVTVEPGIYVPGKGGVRIEDLVLITEGGREILTSVPKMDV